MRDIDQQPEWSGPGGESDFGTSQAPAPAYPVVARPAQDPALAAIERTIEAERAADMYRSAPPDATVVTS